MNSDRIWEHPAIAGRHVVSMGTLQHPYRRHAVCQCGWTFTIDGHAEGSAAAREAAISAHWESVIAAGEPASFDLAKAKLRVAHELRMRR